MSADAPLVPDLLAFQGTLEVGLTDRIGPIGGASLFPVEPRAAITLGLVLSPRSTPAALVDDPDDLQADTITPPDLSVERRTLHGAIAGPDGEALPGVHVRAVDPAAAPGTRPFGEATTVADGSFAIEGVPIDRAVTLEIEADGFTTTRVEVAAGSDGALASAVSLARALPRGALRGLVRTTRGAPIPATVRVEGSDETATADRDGVFELALLPGSYTIVIEAEGRVSQHRTIEVEEGGVTVLNVELRSGH